LRQTSPVVLAFALLALATGGGCASTQQTSEADDVYHQGLAKAAGDTMGAIKIFEDGLGQYPGHIKMRFALGRLQYDTGEIQHVEERRAFAAARKAEDEGKTGDVQKLDREIQDRHAKALPFYRACRENLKIVVSKDDDNVRLAWAYEILMRCDVFFEDYKAAVDDLEKAIDLGHPQGEKLAEWQQFLSDLKAANGPAKKLFNY
jgi:hypothetical protein